MIQQGYPKTMNHPRHVAAVNSVTAIAMGGPTNVQPQQGSAERFPPVDVYDSVQEAYYASRGYHPHGAAQPLSGGHSEYPKMLFHDKYKAGTTATRDAWRDGDGAYHEVTNPGTPEEFPPVTVKNADEQASWEEKGWHEHGVSDGAAFEQALAAPYDPGHKFSEFPKMNADGTVIDPSVVGFHEYPKWVGDGEVNSPAEERAARERLGMEPMAVAKPTVEQIVEQFEKPSDPAREALIRRAVNAGCEVDDTWTDDQILDALMARVQAPAEKPKNKGGRPRKSVAPPVAD